MKVGKAQEEYSVKVQEGSYSNFMLYFKDFSPGEETINPTR